MIKIVYKTVIASIVPNEVLSINLQTHTVNLTLDVKTMIVAEGTIFVDIDVVVVIALQAVMSLGSHVQKEKWTARDSAGSSRIT